MTTRIDVKPRPSGLPADLRQHVGERALIGLALEAAQAVGAPLPRPLESEGRCSPHLLLALLTYCYAACVYGSEDIEDDCRNDAATRYLCANASPDQDTIRSFRRANRPWIEVCLSAVYGKAHVEKPGAGLNAPGDAEFAGIARRKIELAIMFDMAMHD